MLLSFLSFDDDNLPKVRRAIITVASSLAFVQHYGLVINTSRLGFVSSTQQEVDPRFILLPLLIYLLIRLIGVARWYLPLKVSEDSVARTDFHLLTEALEELAKDKIRLKTARDNLDRIAALSVNNLHKDLQAHINELLDERSAALAVTNELKKLLEKLRMTRPSPATDESRKAFSAELAAAQDILENSKMAIGNRYGTSGINAHSKLFDQVKSQSTEIHRLTKSFEDYMLDRSYDPALKALTKLRVETLTASQWKRTETLVFSFLLPLALGGITIMWCALDMKPWELIAA